MCTTKFNIAQRKAIEARVTALARRDEDIKTRVGPILKQLWNH